MFADRLGGENNISIFQEKTVTELVVIPNWFKELRRRVSTGTKN